MANRKTRRDQHVFTISDLAIQAEKRIPKMTSEYLNSGAGDMLTLRDNEASFDRFKLRPRVLRNVANVDTSTTIFGQKISLPLGFAPSAAHKLAHPDGELATSRAAAKNGIPMCLSSWATTSLEDVKQAGGSNPYAMQITFLRDRKVTLNAIQRAEKAGYKALFVSVDLPVLGNRLNEARNEFAFPQEFKFPNLEFVSDEAVSTDDLDYDATPGWKDAIPWLRQHTKLEIWLKGIYCPEDVQLAIDNGIDGVIISNHGGRQLDGVPSTLDALRECAPVAKAGKMPVVLDGGVRRGADLFKALALGADCCFVGRVPLWGLAYKGEAGVDLAVKILLDEFTRTMMLTGCKSVSEITKHHLSVIGQDVRLSKL
ncbi:FMN-dependent dehydrogenase [Polychaeton citri CBS 116435]|uniref:Oxidase FUB9 n=1 Tax=Polychaeton citri CBS 116435 TaxID=1314669 RepID=A0A9P4Q7Z4_9PEZI|nr:FMN-dependent dehydrogenase [Polychaeton citri CBS 116435]